MPSHSMKLVEANGDWSLFCPNEAPGLHEVHGEEFEALYASEKYEKEGRQRKTIPAQKLWYAILEVHIETSGPFMLYKMLKTVCRNTRIYLLCTQIVSQLNQIKRTLAPSSLPTSAPKSWNTLPPTLGQLTSHFRVYGWMKGLKTGMYYLRTRPAAQAIQFTVDQSVLNDAKMQQMNATNVRNAAEVVTAKGTGIPTPMSSTSSSPAQSPITPVKPSTNDSASLAIKQEPMTPSL